LYHHYVEGGGEDWQDKLPAELQHIVSRAAGLYNLNPVDYSLKAPGFNP
jgi:hypothetical protein